MNTTTVRTRLMEERERLTEISGTLEAEAASSTGELSFADQHPADMGSDTFERAKELAILERTQRQLADVERALERLERGAYGICEACGEPIGTARLSARPAARLCLRDQELAEAEESVSSAAST